MRRMRLLGLTALILVLGLAPEGPGQGKPKPKPEEQIKDRQLLAILRDLKHKDPKNRLGALKDLEQRAEVRPSDVTALVPNVFPLLKDPDAGVRRAAILFLDIMEADPKQFVPPLVDILKKDKDSGVRLVAISAVGKIGPPAQAALPALEAIQKGIKDKVKEKMLVAEVAKAIAAIRKK